MEAGSDRAAREKRLIKELAEEFPGWQAERVIGVGWEIYPKGTPIVRSDDLGIARGKLRKKLRGEGADGAG